MGKNAFTIRDVRPEPGEWLREGMRGALGLIAFISVVILLILPGALIVGPAEAMKVVWFWLKLAIGVLVVFSLVWPLGWFLPDKRKVNEKRFGQEDYSRIVCAAFQEKQIRGELVTVLAVLHRLGGVGLYLPEPGSVDSLRAFLSQRTIVVPEIPEVLRQQVARRIGRIRSFAVPVMLVISGLGLVGGSFVGMCKPVVPPSVGTHSPGAPTTGPESRSATTATQPAAQTEATTQTRPASGTKAHTEEYRESVAVALTLGWFISHFGHYLLWMLGGVFLVLAGVVALIRAYLLWLDRRVKLVEEWQDAEFMKQFGKTAPGQESRI